MASFETVLSHIGTDLKKFFGGAITAAQVAEPFVDIIFPGVATIYNATVAAAAQAETAAIAAGAQSGTGEQKLLYVVAAITPTFITYATAQGIKFDNPTITAYVKAVVATLNALPKTA